MRVNIMLPESPILQSPFLQPRPTAERLNCFSYRSIYLLHRNRECEKKDPVYTNIKFEPRYEKTGFLHMQKQRRRLSAQLISAFVFAT